MKIVFSTLKSSKDVKDNIIVNVVSEEFVGEYFKKNGKCKCGNKCKCGAICLCEKTHLQQVIYDSDFKGKNGQIATASTCFGKIIFFGIGKMDDGENKLEQAGNVLYKYLRTQKVKSIGIVFNTLFENGKITEPKKIDGFLEVLNGLLLSCYDFTKYMTEEKAKGKKNLLENINVINSDVKLKKQVTEKELIAKNVFFCRDLQNEPANVIYPESFVALAKKELAKLGVKINVFDEKELKKMGCGGIMSIGQGSEKRPYMLAIEYMNNGKEKPIALVGKGVCFDSGGLSIKTGDFMAHMKTDMSGAAVVLSTIKLLAERKAKVNVVGVMPLVENMPSGGAVRVDDIIKTMSGQTVEIGNTDAEGRVILADALYYASTKYSPKIIIDLATLTGAIGVALGSCYTGLFTNSDDLAKELGNASKNVSGEDCWRMPLHKLGDVFDKAVDSAVADVKNISTIGREAGSVTAAQFLQRFINKHPKWAHLDIAYTAFVEKPMYYVDKGGTGWGVRLLNEFIESNSKK